MKEHNARITLRLPAKEKQQAQQLIDEGKVKNLSQAIRQALKEFLEKEGCV